ncbi:MAG TPA: hypothetical protein VM124_01200 [Candidatus Limnocylindrales bacterium]|nr:hypothetical protein [Candidatus Limnocylindrales bacterium]
MHCVTTWNQNSVPLTQAQELIGNFESGHTCPLPVALDDPFSPGRKYDGLFFVNNILRQTRIQFTVLGRVTCQGVEIRTNDPPHITVPGMGEVVDANTEPTIDMEGWGNLFLPTRVAKVAHAVRMVFSNDHPEPEAVMALRVGWPVNIVDEGTEA